MDDLRYLDGFPVACSVRDDLGLPVVVPGLGVGWDIWLDGVLQKHVLGFDREAGNLWRWAVEPDGKFQVAGGELVMEQVGGEVRLSMRPAERG